VRGGFLNVPQGHAGVQGGGDEGVPHAWIVVFVVLGLGHYRTARVIAVLAIVLDPVWLLQGQLTGSLLAPSGPWAFWIVGPETDRRARHPRIWRQSGRRRRGWGAMIPPLDTGEEELEHAACRVPFRVGLPGLSEHRSEDDDIARSHVLADRAVGTATFDDPLHGAVDLVAHREGFRDGNRQPAMQRQHELVPLGDRGFDEALQRVAGRPAVAFSRPHVREHLLEGTMGKEVKQILASAEMTVERPDPYTRVCRDGRHGHARSLTVHGCGRGTNEGLVIADRVAALFARTRLLHDGHVLIEAPIPIRKDTLKRTKSSGLKD
jgi:hypothetical protein